MTTKDVPTLSRHFSGSPATVILRWSMIARYVVQPYHRGCTQAVAVLAASKRSCVALLFADSPPLPPSAPLPLLSAPATGCSSPSGCAPSGAAIGAAGSGDGEGAADQTAEDAPQRQTRPGFSTGPHGGGRVHGRLKHLPLLSTWCDRPDDGRAPVGASTHTTRQGPLRKCKDRNKVQEAPKTSVGEASHAWLRGGGTHDAVQLRRGRRRRRRHPRQQNAQPLDHGLRVHGSTFCTP